MYWWGRRVLDWVMAQSPKRLLSAYQFWGITLTMSTVCVCLAHRIVWHCVLISDLTWVSSYCSIRLLQVAWLVQWRHLVTSCSITNSPNYHQEWAVVIVGITVKCQHADLQRTYFTLMYVNRCLYIMNSEHILPLIARWWLPPAHWCWLCHWTRGGDGLGRGFVE